MKLTRRTSKAPHTREQYDRVASDLVLAKKFGKIQCLICGLWYRKPLGHCWQRHKVTAREYKQIFGLPLKKGIASPDLAKRFHEMGVENPSWRTNLIKIGARFRFQKGWNLIYKLREKYARLKKTFFNKIWVSAKRFFIF